MMEKPQSTSSWYNVEHVPGNYIFPVEERLGNLFTSHLPHSVVIPVIDLSKDLATQRRQILDAAREFGIFQVINHGISETVMRDAMRVCNKFFEIVAEDKAAGIDPDGSLYLSSIDFDRDGVHLWRESLKHHCHPHYIHSWPQKPSLYRVVMEKYTVEVRKMAMKIIKQISKGLKLEKEHLGGDELTQELSVNRYPPCPDPALTLGLHRHCDPSMITIVHQGDVQGLQVFKDDQWIGVDPIPNAFVVNIGYQLQVISNGKLKAVEHRAVTNSSKSRTSIVMFFNPSFSREIEPAKTLVDKWNPPLYLAFRFGEFLHSYTEKYGDPGTVMQDYMVQQP